MAAAAAIKRASVKYTPLCLCRRSSTLAPSPCLRAIWITRRILFPQLFARAAGREGGVEILLSLLRRVPHELTPPPSSSSSKDNYNFVMDAGRAASLVSTGHIIESLGFSPTLPGRGRERKKRLECRHRSSEKIRALSLSPALLIEGELSSTERSAARTYTLMEFLFFHASSPRWDQGL